MLSLDAQACGHIVETEAVGNENFFSVSPHSCADACKVKCVMAT